MSDIAAALRRWRTDAVTRTGTGERSSSSSDWLSGDILTGLLPRNGAAGGRSVTASPLDPSLDAATIDTPTPTSDDALRLAVRLLTEHKHRGRLLLFGSVGHGRSARALVHEMVLAFLQLNERPLLVLDVNAGPTDAADDLFSEWPACGFHELQVATASGLFGTSRIGPVCVGRAATGEHDGLAFLASTEFAELLRGMRERFAAVLCHAGTIPESVGGLIMARHCDGAVLSVPQGRATASDVRTAIDQLRRVDANVVGFVMEREAERAAWSFRRKGARS